MAVSATNSHVLYREIYNHDQQKQQQPSSSGRSCCTVSVNGIGLYNSVGGFWSDCMKRERIVSRREVKTGAFWDQVAKPTSIELESISDVEQLDQILLEAQEISHPVVIDWMANWCRKCIYLKPKVEKLAAEYNGRVKFYYVDVNKVSKALVERGNISKMPTIQLWKNGEMKEEVIGGHKAWLVIDEIREMIQKHL